MIDPTWFWSEKEKEDKSRKFKKNPRKCYKIPKISKNLKYIKRNQKFFSIESFWEVIKVVLKPNYFSKGLFWADFRVLIMDITKQDITTTTYNW